MSNPKTVEEYAEDVGVEIREAYNAIDRARFLSIVKKAEETLEENNLDAPTRRSFWTLVRKAFNAGPLLMQKTENSALHRLMREIDALLEVKKA